jgi:tetratricopeptide (TPR) repeat protein
VPKPAVSESLSAGTRAAEIKNATGLRLLDQGKLPEAVSTFTEAIALDSNFAEAYGSRCRAYAALSARDRAVDDCNRAIQLRPDYATAYVWRGNAIGSSRWDQALADFSQAIHLDPQLVDAYTARASYYVNHQQADLAIQDYTQAILLHPQYGPYHYRGLTFANQKKDYEHAIQDFTECIHYWPNWPEGYRFRGDAYKAEQQYDRAIQDYNEAIRFEANYVAAYTERAAAKDALGDKAGATADRQKAQELKSQPAPQVTTAKPTVDSSSTFSPQTAEGKEALGLQMLNQGKNEEAILTFTDAINLKPGFAEAFLDRCRAYLRFNQSSMRIRAIEDCDSAIRLKGDFADYWWRGQAHVNQQDFQRGVQDYTEAIHRKPDYFEAYLYRAAQYAAHNQPEFALSDYAKAIQLRPNDTGAYSSRASFYLRQGQTDLAIQDCTDAIKIAPGAYLYKLRGDAYQQRHELGRALQDYDEAIRLSPNGVSYYTARAVVKESLGDKAGAAADRQRIQELSVGKL